MALSSRVDQRVVRRVCGGVLSAALHVVLLLIILAGGRQDGIDAGDTPISKLILIEAPRADHREGDDLPPLTAAVETLRTEELNEALARLAPPRTDAIDPYGDDLAMPQAAPVEVPQPFATAATEIPSTFVLSNPEMAALARRLEQLAEKALEAAQSEVTWEQDGKQFTAVLIRERANDGTALERVTAQVSASDRGRHLTTLVNLQRLAFSQFTQMVDRWDPWVQLHDDEIAGRFHTNTRFNLMYDSRTAPKFLGKVTTAARSFSTESRGRRRDSDIFRGGVETGAGRIQLPQSLQPFEWAPKEEGARLHEFASDTRIRFFADGSYSWRARDPSQSGYLNEPSDDPVYFIARGDATLYVQGVVAGKVLVYSPQRIVIEGDITYAHDPREVADSDDYLGLVSDRYVEIASPGVTGAGDLEIDAAIFAGRRFNVRDIDHTRSATLRIYGSLAAGTLSATEPRYGTKIDYDSRFERQRPPGFPSTNRYEVAEWNGQWTEQPERTAND